MNKAMELLGRVFGGLFLIVVGISCAQASFQLESMGIVLEESTGRTSFSIKNTTSEPILLATKVEDLDGKAFSKQVMISPPISRIDAGQSQQVNFVLKQGAVLPHEVMLKASFEGVGQAVDNSARIPVRQSIGLIVQPKAVAVSKTPWEDLQLSQVGNTLVVKNSGLHVIRLAPQLTLQPSKQVVLLENYYLMAGEEKQVTVSGKVTSVGITPLGRYGFKQADITLPVK
ncbi:fimbria/pilus chaperone family protein [Serratia fonticola]|uniref:fimbria/pilus chaperone family protein n=1 Tax=Serratia fonticola TaxID=47917 RepID=UPI0003AC9294|nr:fimbria/pilus chaperone family protein [Serratia fonticola]ERK08930.1 Beta-fimbriae chaperone protein [Serratia fonticola AU-P3(3)]MEB7883689.1 fimbria/pilus chaperone family protein [Serratia fonticola]